MEAHPDAGIIQTAPQRGRPRDAARPRPAVRRARLRAAVHRSACASGSSANRTTGATTRSCASAPFIDHCALRAAAGRRRRSSGEIMSHDFVEAALMRRAGWKVWVADDLDGSYEQVPPNLLAELQRDRRWCQGNLQNSRLMFEPRLHPVHRTAFLTGVLAYAVVAALARVPAAVDAAVRADTRAAIRPTSSSRTSCSRSGRPPTSPLMLTLFGLTGCAAAGAEGAVAGRARRCAARRTASAARRACSRAR